MASVFELSEPYRNHLVSVLPPGRGVCAICWTAIDPGYRLCYPCRIAREGYGGRLAEIVVPIALAVKRQQLAHELWHYKYDVDGRVRQRLQVRLAALLWRFLGQHEPHIAAAVGGPGFDIVTTVPGTRIRDEDHPLVHIVGTLVGQTRDRYQPVLALGPGASVEGRAVLANRYRATEAMAGRPAVLLVDDTWTAGGRPSLRPSRCGTPERPGSLSWFWGATSTGTSGSVRPIITRPDPGNSPGIRAALK